MIGGGARGEHCSMQMFVARDLIGSSQYLPVAFHKFSSTRCCEFDTQLMSILLISQTSRAKRRRLRLAPEPSLSAYLSPCHYPRDES
jgi:hypothetical protein